MALNKQTITRCQCFCLRQDMPRDISVIGCIEDEVLFSFLPKTKIERLPSLSIFSFVYVVQSWPTIHFVGLVEPVYVLCLVAAGIKILLNSPPVPTPSSFFRSHGAPSGQNTLLYRGIDGCQRLPLLLGNISLNEGLW